jgi:hypothetical protein
MRNVILLGVEEHARPDRSREQDGDQKAARGESRHRRNGNAPIIRIVSDSGLDAFQKPPAGQAADIDGADDPVSWLQIESGWSVVTAEGDAVGTVAQVAGAKEQDIFDGLAVQAPGSTQLVYVPGEQVAAIYPGRVTLKITAAQAAELGPYTAAPPQKALELPRESFTARVRRWFHR